MPSFISPAYRGPLVIFALGVGFAVVGAVPLAVTMSIGARSSATIIGMGFIGFGFLLMLPSVFWCMMVRTHSLKTLRRRLKRGKSTEDAEQDGAEDDAAEQTPALRKSGDELKGDKAATPRSKCWPPSYRDPPPLIVTDYGVCRASTPINCPSVDDPERSGTTATVDAEPPDRRTSPASVPVITTTTTDEDDDELRLLATVDQRVDNVPSGMPLHVDGTAPALCEA